MIYDMFFAVRDLIIIVLASWLFITFRKIKELEKTLAEEKRKRLFPLLTLEVDMDKGAMFLRNDSYCYAKNIVISDVKVMVDVGFKKGILLKFEPVEMLKPDQGVELKYRMFDGEYELSGPDVPRIVYYFDEAGIELNLRYANIEDAEFVSTLGKENDKYVIKDARPA